MSRGMRRRVGGDVMRSRESREAAERKRGETRGWMRKRNRRRRKSIMSFRRTQSPSLSGRRRDGVGRRGGVVVVGVRRRGGVG
ncbi:hypothetical protein E2C01_063362 [Portunus trituberculatus]|uniref:Uncharacterized protein n=1 Tax=Portunus trituberculatus TaxID=210409 RepID=A0A5B7HIR4_PORTR|nr:hypothetical protein [Portunus trituberculatus]